MVECSLCSFMNCIIRIIYNGLVAAMDYPIVIFIFSVLLAVAVICNIHMAKLMCDFSNVAARRCGLSTTPGCSGNAICTLRNSVDYGVERGVFQ